MSPPPEAGAQAPVRQALLDDHPAGAGNDRLRFGRYLEVIDQLVLQRESKNALVTAIYGPWGSGKSSLLALLKRRLEEINGEAEAQPAGIGKSNWLGWLRRKLGSFWRKDKRTPEQIRKASERFQVVEFSPWLYRNEKSLLVPLLATLAKNHAAFEHLMGDIMDAAPDLTRQVVESVGKLAIAGTEMAAMGLPLLTFLAQFRSRDKKRADDKKGPIQELTEKIEKAVQKTASGNQRIVFLIDDLDRCHDPAQVVGLLEQIKLLLHFDRCLFFIAADRQQIIAAIEKLFPGSGKHYLEKFVQLGVDLSPHAAEDLVALLPLQDAAERSFFRRLAAAINNPRQFKQIYNQAVLLRRLVGQHIDSEAAMGLTHQSSLILAAKCIVLRESTAFGNAAGRAKYLRFEFGPRDEATREAFLAAISPQLSAAPAKDDAVQAVLALAQAIASRKSGAPPAIGITPALHALGSFLWVDIHSHVFGSARLLGLYATLGGERHEQTRQEIELALSEGKIEFASREFGIEDFRDARFAGASFVDCRFIGTQMAGADLQGAKFIRCFFEKPDMTGAHLHRVEWQDCTGLDTIEADAQTLATLAFQWLRHD